MMHMNDINSAVQAALTFYKSNNLDIPTNVTEYIGKYPPGLSRQVLSSKYNAKCSDFVKLLNPEYTPPLCAQLRAEAEAIRLGYTIVSDTSVLRHNRQSVELKCNSCGYLHTATITSLAGTLRGCPRCKSKNLPWNRRKEELASICRDRLDASIISDIPGNQYGYITLKHSCGLAYTTQLVGVVSPNSQLRATCPHCRPTDRRVVEDGITFGSGFEAECYLRLKHLSPELHVKYADYFSTTRRWVCDFKVGSYWIEVSNFKTDYKNYFANIEEKRSLVEGFSDHQFFFVTSIKELDELISLM